MLLSSSVHYRHSIGNIVVKTAPMCFLFLHDFFAPYTVDKTALVECLCRWF